MIAGVIAVAASYVFYGVGCGLDVQASEAGYAKGYTEANEIVSGIFGPKPKAWELYVYDLTWAMLVTLPAIVWPQGTTIAAASGAVAAAGGKHLLAVRKWNQMEAGTYKQPSSAFLKFLGM